MATNKFFILALGFVSGAAGAREAASPTACQAAAAQPAIVSAKSALDRSPRDLRADFNLADAWSDAGCFNDAVHVLQAAEALHAGNKELETRLRVARSLVGEAHFFDNLDRANEDAKLRRSLFRCTTLADPQACAEAVRIKSDDPAVLVAQGDALAREKRPAEALSHYRRADALAPNQPVVASKINATEAQLAAATTAAPSAAVPAPVTPSPVRPAPVARTVAALIAPRVAGVGPMPERRYSNAAPETQSH